MAGDLFQLDNELDHGDYDYIGVVRVYQCRRCGAEGEFEATRHGLVDEYSGKTHNCFDTWRQKYGRRQDCHAPRS